LGRITDLVEELDTTIARLDKTGGGSVGYVSNGADEKPLPINMAATEPKLLLRDRLISWCRDLWETNAARNEDGSVPPLDLRFGVAPAALWLLRHPSWIASHEAVYELYDEVMETTRLAWRAVDTAPDRVYIGTCSAPLAAESGTEQCAEELYARDGDWEKRCPGCGTIHDVRERQAALAAAVEHQYVSPGFLVGLVRDRGDRLTTAMLRSLLRRGRIAAFVHLDENHPGAGVLDRHGWLVRPWVSGQDPVDVRLYRVGQVLDAITNRYSRQAA
jgi:hypothetical protein